MARYFATHKVTPKLLQPGKLGDLELSNRVIMSSLTRQRSMKSGEYSGVPTDLHAQYYSLRAKDAGLVLTECSAVSKDGDAFPGEANIFNEH